MKKNALALAFAIFASMASCQNSNSGDDYTPTENTIKRFAFYTNETGKNIVKIREEFKEFYFSDTLDRSKLINKTKELEAIIQSALRVEKDMSKKITSEKYKQYYILIDSLSDELDTFTKEIEKQEKKEFNVIINSKEKRLPPHIRTAFFVKSSIKGIKELLNSFPYGKIDYVECGNSYPKIDTNAFSSKDNKYNFGVFHDWHQTDMVKNPYGSKEYSKEELKSMKLSFEIAQNTEFMFSKSPSVNGEMKTPWFMVSRTYKKEEFTKMFLSSISIEFPTQFKPLIKNATKEEPIKDVNRNMLFYSFENGTGVGTEIWWQIEDYVVIFRFSSKLNEFYCDLDYIVPIINSFKKK